MEPATARVTRNGQVSIPATIRRRWGADRVIVIDRGDYVIVRPVPADIVGSLLGKYAGPGPASDEIRVEQRAAEAEREARG